jgi:hypothetical protein
MSNLDIKTFLPINHACIRQAFRLDKFMICHQTNCISIGSAGVAKAIFSMEPEMGYPNLSKNQRQYGKIHIGKRVINMNAQLFPGKPRNESEKQERVGMFMSCLGQIISQCSNKDVKGFIFPFGIGCGLADGDWKCYNNMIECFASACNRKVSYFSKPDVVSANHHIFHDFSNCKIDQNVDLIEEKLSNKRDREKSNMDNKK